jgi:hypothetical protein
LASLLVEDVTEKVFDDRVMKEGKFKPETNLAV